MTVDPFSDKAAEEFVSGGALSAQWPKVGHVVEGTVVGWEMTQQTDYDTQEPLVWEGKKKVVARENDSRRPVVQMALTIQGEPTGLRYDGTNNYEPVEVPDDDGIRVLYVKGGLQAAIRNAIRDAKGRLEEGAYIKVTRAKDGQKTNPKFKAPHRYAVEWTPASRNEKAANDVLNDDGDEQSPFEDAA